MQVSLASSTILTIAKPVKVAKKYANFFAVQIRGAALSQKPRRTAFWRVRRDAGVDFLAEKNTGAPSPPSDDAAGAWAPSLSATVPPNGPRFGAFFASRALDPATGL